jgi:hypothetical protein
MRAVQSRAIVPECPGRVKQNRGAPTALPAPLAPTAHLLSDFGAGGITGIFDTATITR